MGAVSEVKSNYNFYKKVFVFKIEEHDINFVFNGCANWWSSVLCE